MSKDQRYNLSYAIGRLDGLSGTVRYKISDALRKELREISALLHEIESPGRQGYPWD